MKRILALAALLLTSTWVFATGPNELIDPPTFYSSNQALDVLITAKAKPITLDTYSPAAWVYEVCYRTDATGNTCPTDARTASAYGGMRLQLNAGDHLKIRFINQLPPAPPDAEHVQEMPEMLKDNPSEPSHARVDRGAAPGHAGRTQRMVTSSTCWLIRRGSCPTIQMPGLDYTDQPLDYDIYIPPTHPRGLFWIHPHVHGLAFNQMSYGMAGIITIGSVNADIFPPGFGFCAILPIVGCPASDIEGHADPSGRSTVLSQEDPGFL